MSSRLKFLESELDKKKNLPFWDIFDIDRNPKANMLRLFLFRLFMTMAQVHFMYHPDENWQSLEIAYDLLYGEKSSVPRGHPDKVDILFSWEWYNFYALRNHLYPFYLSIPGRFLKMVQMDSNFMLVNSMYFMHVVVWSFGDYYFYKLIKLLAGTECAIFTTMVSMTNETVNRYVSRTSMNGVEGNLAVAALYFYHQMDKPKFFDKNLNKMTLLITVCFIARSSSLAAWIPLALFKIVEDYNFFLPILVAGLTVAVPAIVISTLIDSFYYGAFTSP